ncbi:MAG TPA: peptide-methionine (S)-S-oxide reductase MsrA [Hyphomicrobiaceae bacterium]|nr:peptide-methionine (S)-S-oxide reductase MsrA [Hyphomicrobiaceae bacterium]
MRMAAHAKGLRAVLVAAAMLLPLGLRAAMAEEARVIPAPALDEPATQDGTRTIVLAGGCFWGVQGVFQHTKGVISAVSGYAGGDRSTARYEKVTTGATGHAESVQITYDPRQITYGRLLRVFFSVVHDPTQLNRQGPDIGTQYRSAIFPADAEQARIAKAYVAQLNQARAFPAAIVTRIEADRPFYPAEAYHQDFMARNPTYPYIVYNDAPKLADLQRIFPDLYRSSPVLVSAARSSN